MVTFSALLFSLVINQCVPNEITKIYDVNSIAREIEGTIHDECPYEYPYGLRQVFSSYDDFEEITASELEFAAISVAKRFSYMTVGGDIDRVICCEREDGDGVCNNNKNSNGDNNEDIAENNDMILDDEDMAALDAGLEAIYGEDEEEMLLFEKDEEPEKTIEELLQEVDTLDNRDRYLQELIVHSSNSAQVKANKHKKTCYFSREGYWNYELCLYDKIEQFHGQKNKRNPNIKLGKFVTYVDITKILMNDQSYPYIYLKDIYGIHLFENTEKNYIHLLYRGGEAKRESLVTIQCSKAYGKRTKDGIIKITEPKEHNYHFIFIYKSVCEYETWLKREYNIYDEEDEDIFSYNDHDNEITFIDDAIYETSSSAALFAKMNVDIKQEHVIGRWDEDKLIDKNSFIIHKNANDPSRTYASIIYDDGDTCDLTKVPRKTEIQFRCGLNDDAEFEKLYTFLMILILLIGTLQKKHFHGFIVVSLIAFKICGVTAFAACDGQGACMMVSMERYRDNYREEYVLCVIWNEDVNGCKNSPLKTFIVDDKFRMETSINNNDLCVVAMCGKQYYYGVKYEMCPYQADFTCSRDLIQDPEVWSIAIPSCRHTLTRSRLDDDDDGLFDFYGIYEDDEEKMETGWESKLFIILGGFICIIVFVAIGYGCRGQND